MPTAGPVASSLRARTSARRAGRRGPHDSGLFFGRQFSWAPDRRLLHDSGLFFGGDGSAPVWICENPAVVSVAVDQLGRSCAPLVCAEGMPAAVTASLLDLLSSVRADLRVHTDFDVGGMMIARHITGRVDARPWNLGRASYLRAIDGPTCSLGQSVGPTPWDPALSAAMDEHRLAVHEEAIVHELLRDLDQR